MKLLFLFLDGVGLGPDNPEFNPLSVAKMPVLLGLLNGQRLVENTPPLHSLNASLLALGTTFGVDGMPQSGTGQAVLLTGQNIPAEIGFHYGPWPNKAIIKFLEKGNIFDTLIKAGKSVDFLNAYPQRYFDTIDSGKRLYSSIPYAATSAGLKLKTIQELIEGQAIAADFTGQGLHDHLGLRDIPILTPEEAGKKLAQIASATDFSFFEYWISDYVGHGQDMQAAVKILESLDQVFAGLLGSWDIENDLILVTSDHGNLEDLSTRRHTMNPVPALIIGSHLSREVFTEGLRDLTDITPAVLRILGVS